jgi:hypothetical protein
LWIDKPIPPDSRRTTPRRDEGSGGIGEGDEMKVWFDTEFIEYGKTIDLISIGLVREDGKTFYAECEEADKSRASEWVMANILPHLTGYVSPRSAIAESIKKFAGDIPKFWGYYADYDWVALCQLYGTMMNLPDGWPMYCRDIKQLCDELGNPKLPKQTSTEHNALNDAIWTRDAHVFLTTYAEQYAAVKVAEEREACADIADSHECGGEDDITCQHLNCGSIISGQIRLRARTASSGKEKKI